GCRCVRPLSARVWRWGGFVPALRTRGRPLARAAERFLLPLTLDRGAQSDRYIDGDRARAHKLDPAGRSHPPHRRPPAPPRPALRPPRGGRGGGPAAGRGWGAAARGRGWRGWPPGGAGARGRARARWGRATPEPPHSLPARAPPAAPGEPAGRASAAPANARP